MALRPRENWGHGETGISSIRSNQEVFRDLFLDMICRARECVLIGMSGSRALATWDVRE
jgi:hypothetical protein